MNDDFVLHRAAPNIMGNQQTPPPAVLQEKVQEQLLFDKTGIKVVTDIPIADVNKNEIVGGAIVNYDDCVIRDCVLLSEASYDPNPSTFLASKGHRFTALFEAQLGNSDGHFLIAEYVDEKTSAKIVYLSIRGSTNIEDWKQNVSAWSTVETVGIVHFGWYSRSAHIPGAFLYDRLINGWQVVVTGYSLGGAVAQLVMVSLLAKLILLNNATEIKKRLLCVTFAAPLVMAGLGVKRTNDHNKENFINFIHQSDAVPKILSWCQGALDSLAVSQRGKAQNKPAEDFANSAIELIGAISADEPKSSLIFAAAKKLEHLL